MSSHLCCFLPNESQLPFLDLPLFGLLSGLGCLLCLLAGGERSGLACLELEKAAKKERKKEKSVCSKKVVRS